MRTVTQSELRAWMSCNRRHWFAYGKHLRPKRTPSVFLQGTAFHDGVAAYYGGQDEDVVLSKTLPLLVQDEVVNVDGEYRDPEETERGEYMAAKIRGMLRAYSRQYAGNEFLRVGHLEERFVVPYSDKWSLSGRFDGVAMDSDGRWWLLEHKTASGGAVDMLTRLRLDFQVNFYLHMADLLVKRGEIPQVVGVVYNVVVKPAIRPIQVWAAEWYDESACATSKAELVRDMKKRCSDFDERYAHLEKRRQVPDEYEERIFEIMLAAPQDYFYRRYVMPSEDQKKDFAAELDVILAAFPDAAPFPNFQSCERCPYRMLCEASPSERQELAREFFDVGREL